MAPSPKETTARVAARAASAKKSQQVRREIFDEYGGQEPAEFLGVTEGAPGRPGMAKYRRPDGNIGYVSVPPAYTEWPHLWPNPAIKYPWRPRHFEWGGGSKGKRDQIAAHPNLCVE